LKLVLKLSYWLLLLLLPTACSEPADEPEPLPEPAPQPIGPQDTQRTVLVYMVANNNLGNGGYSPGEFDLDDIDEMRIAAKNGALGSNRLILFHSRKGSVELKEVTATEVKTLKSYSTAFSAVEAANMRTVIADVKALAPARNYGIVLWSHANGWLQTGIEEPAQIKRAFGDDRGRSMNISTLASVLKGEDFDFVYFDCCFMGGVEVAYQLREVTPTVVASASELPSPGMPYDRTIPYLIADEADPVGAAEATFNYYNGMSGYVRTCTMSVIRTDALPALAGVVREIYSTFPNVTDKLTIQQFASRYSSSFYDCFYDLRHYLHDMCNVETPDGQIAYAKAAEAIYDCVAYQNSTPWLWEGKRDQVKIEWHCGLTTYIVSTPEEVARRGYDRLDWYEDVASAIFN